MVAGAAPVVALRVVGSVMLADGVVGTLKLIRVAGCHGRHLSVVYVYASDR